MKKFFRMAAPVLVLAAGFGIVQVLVAAKQEPEKKEESQRLVSLYVDEVKSEMVTVSVVTQGEVRPKTEIDLIPQVSGRIIAMNDVFAEGGEFTPGTMLLKIDDADYKLAVVRAEALVAEAHTVLERELATARIKEDQWADKRTQGEPTPFALNIPQVDEARAKIRSADADLQGAKLNLARTEIIVPFHGRVRERNVGIGQFVSSGTKLGRVFSIDTVEVKLPLTDVQLVELNLPMGFTAGSENAPVVNFKAAIGNKEYFWQGRIVRVNAAIDQDTRLIYATAEVLDPYGSAASEGMPLAVGLFVSAEIEGVTPQTAYVMPRLALRSANKVYVINDENKLEIRTVEVLSTSEERVVVTNGVVSGERVVTSTLPAAVDGMQVQAITREPHNS